MGKSPHILAQFFPLTSHLCTHMYLQETFYCFYPVFPAERAVRQTPRTSANTEDGFSLNREHDGTMGGGYRTIKDLWASILNMAQRLKQTGEVAVTLSGVCLCTFWIALLYQLLWGTKKTPNDPSATAEAQHVPNCDSWSRSHHIFAFQKHQELFWVRTDTDVYMSLWICLLLTPEITFMV